MPDFKTATVIKNDVIASTYHDLIFETPELFSFNPGQFVTIKVAEKLVRSYSIAGQVTDHQFGLLVDTKPGGPGSQYFKGLKPGDQVQFIGPAGVFTLKPHDGSTELVFLGTGSGIAPLKAMVETCLRDLHLTFPMTLYFGLRYQADIHWQDYFQSFADQHSNFRFKLVLSKPEPGWTGLTGHITDFLATDYPNDTSHLGVYLCGNGKMIEEASGYLQSHGTPETRIYHEKFF